MDKGKGKGAFLGWLSKLHWRREFLNLTYPDTPALARLMEQSNSLYWDEECYHEMQELGRVSGLHFSRYLQQIGTPYARRGSCAAYPIDLDEDLDSLTSDDDSTFSISPVSVGGMDIVNWQSSFRPGNDDGMSYDGGMSITPSGSVNASDGNYPSAGDSVTFASADSSFLNTDVMDLSADVEAVSPVGGPSIVGDGSSVESAIQSCAFTCGR